MRLSRISSITILNIATVLLCTNASAASLAVAPVRIALNENDPVATMRIENVGAEATRVQLRVFSWHQSNGEEFLEPTRDILVNPSLFEVKPDKVQLARFGLRTQSGAIEKSYRLVLDEIPEFAPNVPGHIRTLLRITIPIFVTARGEMAKIIWNLWPEDSKSVMISARNTGNAHLQINQLELERPDGTKLGIKAMSTYLLPGSLQLIALAVTNPVHSGEALKLTAVTDQANIVSELVSEALPHENGHP